MQLSFPLAADVPIEVAPIDAWMLVAYSLGGILALAVMSILWHGWAQRERRPYTSPSRLFAQLCRAHALDRASRRVLVAVARHQKLGNPSRLFLEPQRWQDGPLGHVLLQYPKHVERLRRRLFGVTYRFGD